METSKEPIVEKRSRLKKGWRITKIILGHLLPFLIVSTIPISIWYLLNQDQEGFDLEIRQSKLEENWEEYIVQAGSGNRDIQISKFELTLCPFAEDVYAWDESVSPEEAGLICGNVIIPLYHDDPDGKTILLPISIWPYPDPTENPDPLFIMQGGPGGSTLDSYPDWLYGSRPGGEREIIFVDQRGTRYANPSLICTEEDEPEENDDPQEEKNDDDFLTYLATCHDRLVSEGVDLSAFNTAEIAHDMEFIRKVFDYSKINFYGVSYGSHIAQYLAVYHPEGLRSLILDGVAPIPLDYLDKSYTHTNRLLEDYLIDCEEDDFCSENYPDLSKRINDIIDQLDEKPISITLHDPDSSDTETEEISGDDFLMYLIFMFRMESSYAILPYLVAQAEKGHFDLYKSFGEMLTFEEVDSDGLYYSVVSAEHTPFVITTQNDYLIPKLSEIEVENLEENQEEWAVWEISPSSEILTEMPWSSVPTLLMSGYYDPITPPEYGSAALESFPNGQHVIDPVGGHGIAFDDDCTENILDDFLDKPEQVVDSECIYAKDRKNPLVPPDAFPAPSTEKFFRHKDIALLTIIIPLIAFLLMAVRGGFQYLRYLWQKNRRNLPQTTIKESRLQLRFELAAWVFILSCIVFVFFLWVTIAGLYNHLEFMYAQAFPGRIRGTLFIPVLLCLVTAGIFLSTIQLWPYRKRVFARVYLLIQVLLTGSFVAYLIWSGLLWAWAK